MNILFYQFAALVSDASNSALLLIGIATLIGGVMLMLRHKSEIDSINDLVRDTRLQLFHQRKFRRRTLASTLIAAIGILMIALCWAIEPAIFIGLVSVILILLMAVMFIALLDLMSVSLHTVASDDTARREMINEYLRQRQKLLDRVDEHDGNSNC